MKKSDLYREWARVLDMCEGTKVKPEDCWSLNGRKYDARPEFDADPEYYQFAIAILEDKPVFVGDEVYFKDGTRRIVNCTGGTIPFISTEDGFSWNPPNKTFMLNGEELPCPQKIQDATK